MIARMTTRLASPHRPSRSASLARRPVAVPALVLLLAAVSAWWLAQPSGPPSPPAPAAPAAGAQTFATLLQQVPATPGAPAPQGAGPGAAAVQVPPASAGPLLDPDTLALKPAARPMFRADAQGRLVHDEHTRVQVEKLLALHSTEEVLQRLDTATAGLPAAAAAQARDLVQRVESYQQAQRQAFAPDAAPLVPEDGLAQLQTLQAMRSSHFGADKARQLFGQEEAVTRRLLQLMQLETDTRLSMADKAVRAQARYDQERGAGQP